MAANFFRGLFPRRGNLSPQNSLTNDDSYQQLTDNQPQNIYREALLLYGHEKPVRHLEVVDSSCFVSASDDSKVIVWDSVSGRCKHTMDRHTSPVTCVLPLPSLTASSSIPESDDPVLLTSSHNELILWELSSDERFDSDHNLRVITEHNSKVNCLIALGPSGMVCSGGENLCLWDYSGKLLSSFDRSVILAEDSSDIHSILQMEGRNFGIIAASDSSQPAVYDIKKSTVTQQSCYQLELCRYLISPHHEKITALAPVSGTFFASGSADGTVVIWSMNSLSAVKLFNCCDSSPITPPPSPLSASSLSFSGASSSSYCPQTVHTLMMMSERYLFAAYSCGFKIFDVISSEGYNEGATQPLPLACHRGAHKAPITHFEFLTHSSQLATSSQDGTLRLWGSRNQQLSKKDLSVAMTEKMSVEEFLSSPVTNSGFRMKRKSQIIGQPLVPLLIGEMGLHSGPIQKVRYLGENGLVTCGDDGVIILWKNLQLENDKRNQEIQKYLREETFYDASLLTD